MAWRTLENGQRRCDEHDETFSRTTVCSKADSGCGAPSVAIAPVTLDKELALIESELRAEARYYRKLGRELCDGTERDIAVGLKAAEVSLKFDRAYKELVERRKEYEHDKWLVEQKRQLDGGNGDHH